MLEKVYLLWMFILSAIILTLLMISLGGRWKQPCQKAFNSTVLCMMLWTVTYIVEMLSNTAEIKILASQFQFIGICFLPVCYLYIVYSFVGIERTKVFYLALSLIPVITLILIWIPPPTPFWGNPSMLEYPGSLNRMNYDYRWWFYAIHAPYGYILIVHAIIVLLRFYPQMQRIHKHQIIFLLLAILFPLFIDILYVLGISIQNQVNFTTASFGISSIIMYIALKRGKLFDLIPVARKLIIDSLSNGILVLDIENRLVDMNEMATQICRINNDMMGKKLEEITFLHASLKHKMLNFLHTGEKEIIWDDIESQQSFKIQKNTITDRRKSDLGWVISIHNETTSLALLRKFEFLSRMDDLTQVYNRRYMLETGELKFSTHKEQNKPLSIIMLDIDHFKIINDTYGHTVGDQTMYQMAKSIEKHLRKNDILGRIGGDEFLLLLSNTTIQEAYEWANTLFHSIVATQFTILPENSTITVSIGISSTELIGQQEDFERLIALADRALYSAKEHGRSQICVASID